MTIKTNDLALATALSLESPIVNMEKEGKRAIFYFEATLVTEHTQKAFWEGKYLVDALRFYNALKSLKARINDTI